MGKITIKVVLLGLLATVVVAFGQTTFTDWQGNPLNLSGQGCVMDAIPYMYTGYACVIKYTGTGAWSASGSSQYGPSARICLLAADHSCNGGTLSGTGPVELRIYPSFDGIDNYASGSFSRAVTFNGVTIPATIRLHAPVVPVYGSYSRQTETDLLAAGCAKDSYFVNLCPDAQIGPNGGYTVPPVGTWGVEPNFGTPIMNVGNDHLPYSEFAYTSADSGLVETQHLGFVALPNNNLGLAPGAAIYKSGFGSNVNCGFYTNSGMLTNQGWNEATWFCGNGNSLHRVRGIAPSFTTYVDDGAIFALPDGQTSICLFTAIPDGHVLAWGAMNGDCANNHAISNWHYVYLVNLYPPHNYTRIDLTSAPWAAQIYTRRFEVLGVDTDGWYYLHDGSGNGNDSTNGIHWYRFKLDGTVDWIGSIPSNIGWAGTIPSDCTANGYKCLQSGHQAAFNHGNAMGVFVQGGYQYSPEDVAQVYNPMRGPLYTTMPVQLGGGATWAFGGHDYQTAAKTRPLVASSFQWQNGFGWPRTMGVQSVSGNTFTLQDWVTGSSSLGTLNAGDQILIGCENSNPGTGKDIRGLWTVTSVATGPYRVTVSGLNYSGTYGGAFCAAVKATPIAPTSTNARAGVYLYRFSQNGDIIQVTRVAKRRTPPWGCCLSDSGSDAYTSGAFTQITQDGRFVLWDENNYVPNDMHIMAAQTPYPMLSLNDYELAPGYPVRTRSLGSGQVQLQARVPEAVDVTCKIATTADFTQDSANGGACISGVTPTAGCSFTLAGPYTVRSATFTGAPGQSYRWRCSSADNFYAATGAFAVR
jgi:hypothetical protein